MATRTSLQEPNARQAKAKKKAAGASKPAGDNAIDLLKADHRTVEQLFDKFQTASDEDQKRRLAEQICDELIIHAEIEESIFYPACRDAIEEESLLDEAQVEHDSAKILIADVMEGDAGEEFFDAKVKVLAEYVKHHIREEEKRDGVFAQAKKNGVDLDALGRRISGMKQELKAQAERRGFEPPQPVSLDLIDAPSSGRRRGWEMARRRDSDAQDRFLGDEESYGRGGWSERGRSRHEEEEEDYGRGRSRGYAGRSRRGEEEDDYRARSRGEGGWFGDPEGHAEAARRGWERRADTSGYRTRRDEADDRYGRGRSYRDEDGRRSDRGQGGWFGDSEGHSRAARRGWEDLR
jgi:hypothetical protein